MLTNNGTSNDDPTTAGVVVVDELDQKPPLTATIHELKQLLAVIQHQIIPLTEQSVARGNKVFGAAILNADNLTDKAFCATNKETGKRKKNMPKKIRITTLSQNV
jgi:hypothetical protein